MIRRNARGLVARILYIIAGSFIYAFAINSLLLPHELLSGGVTGISMILEYALGWPTAVTIIILNIPLFVGGYRYISKRFIYFSILGTVSVSLFLSLTKGWVMEVNNPIIASIFGGLISGVGAGIVLKNRGSLGGTDILSVMVNKHFSFSIGETTIIFNTIVLVLAAVLFDVERSMYTMIALFVSIKTIDAIQEGFNKCRTVLIVSDHSQELAKELFFQIKRGITFLDGEGAYTGQEKRIIYMVVRIMELAKVKDIVIKVDPEAFMSVIDTKETMGKGFDIGNLF